MKPRHCVIIVENLPVPFDRHVWQQASTLRDAGWKVTVICPRGASAPVGRERLEGIEIFRHALPREGSGFWSHIAEYLVAMFHEARLLLKIALSSEIDVIHACNPPDLIFLIAAPYKLFGVKFVFDHHDLAPELFETLYGGRAMHAVLLQLERWSFGLADLVLSSNETFREIAIDRGRKAPHSVSVVRTIPDVSRFRRVAPDTTARAEKRLVLGYLGIIGHQDGLDHLIEAARILSKERGLCDFQLVVVGDGPALELVVARAKAVGVAERTTFRGYLSGEPLWAQVSDFDIGIIPDPRNSFNDKVSMNKVFEYSALGIPIVCYALRETVRMLADAGTYAAADDPVALADAIESLMLDDALRRDKGRQVLEVSMKKFDWTTEAQSLVDSYDRLVPKRS